MTNTIISDIDQYDALIGDGRFGRGGTIVQKRRARAHVQMQPTHLTCISLLSNGSLAAHQVQTQSAQQFARYGNLRVCTLQMQPTLTCVKLVSIGPLVYTQNLNAILPAVCEIWKRKVCTCARVDALHLRHA